MKTLLEVLSSKDAKELISLMADAKNDIQQQELAGSMLKDEALIAAAYAWLQEPSSGTEHDPLCMWLFDLYSSDQTDLKRVTLQFIPVLLWVFLYRRTLGLHVAGIQSCLLNVYNREALRRDFSPLYWHPPFLHQASPYHFPKEKPKKDEKALTEVAVKQLESVTEGPPRECYSSSLQPFSAAIPGDAMDVVCEIVVLQFKAQMPFLSRYALDAAMLVIEKLCSLGFSFFDAAFTDLENQKNEEKDLKKEEEEDEEEDSESEFSEGERDASATGEEKSNGRSKNVKGSSPLPSPPPPLLLSLPQGTPRILLSTQTLQAFVHTTAAYLHARGKSVALNTPISPSSSPSPSSPSSSRARNRHNLVHFTLFSLSQRAMADMHAELILSTSSLHQLALYAHSTPK